MNRYIKMFSQLEEQKKAAFVPFVTLGDPDIDTSLEIIRILINSGADALELGIPFSDPVADGPTIQNSVLRAFNSGITKDACFQMIQKIRTEFVDIPIGLLVYANLAFADIERFYSLCQASGVDSVLIPDIPLHESELCTPLALKYAIDQVFICPPNIDEAKVKKLAELSQGYVYLLSRPGITGTEKRADMPVDTVINLLQKYNSAPPLLGFGISDPSQFKDAIIHGAKGVIVGSAIVKIIENNLDNQDKLFSEIREFVVSMKQASIL